MQIGEFSTSLSPQEMQQWFSSVLSTKAVSLSSFSKETTALVVMDMINGFAVSGALYSPNTASIVPQLAQLMKACRERELPIVFFADSILRIALNFSLILSIVLLVRGNPVLWKSWKKLEGTP